MFVIHGYRLCSWHHALVNKLIGSITLQDSLQDIDVLQGNLVREEAGDVSRFLNRILGLKVHQQNLVRECICVEIICSLILQHANVCAKQLHSCVMCLNGASWQLFRNWV